MTSKLVCPFCGEELAKDENLDGGAYVPYFCENDKCMKSFLFYGTKELWQVLIQARQDLEIATKALEEIDTLLRSRKFDITELSRLNIIQYLVSCTLKSTEHNEYIC